MKKKERIIVKPSQGKTFTGVVVSTKMAKTVVVAVNQIYRHPLYKKAVRRTKRIPAEIGELKPAVGDRVRLVETRPLSKTKHFLVVEKLEASL